MNRINGIEYIADYVDHQTHDQLLAAVDTQPWLNSVDHGVQIYGYRYNKQSAEAFKIGELTDWALAIAARFKRDGLIDTVPNQLVANAYPAGTGIFDHVDQQVFGSVVISLSLASTCVMRFTRSASNDSEDLLLEPRSIVVLKDDARWHCTHGIPARRSDTWKGREYVRGRRVSLTFRAVPEA